MCRNNRRHKSFENKILPASDCGSKIFAQFPATTMIPIDQGGGGVYPKTNKNPSRACSPTAPVTRIFAAEIHNPVWRGRPRPRVSRSSMMMTIHHEPLIQFAIHKSNTDVSHRSSQPQRSRSTHVQAADCGKAHTQPADAPANSAPDSPSSVSGPTSETG